MAEAGARRPFFRRRKTCPFTGPNAPKIDYKDSKLLMRGVRAAGHITHKASGSSGCRWLGFSNRTSNRSKGAGQLMIATLLIALAAGCASALMFASIISGALISPLLFYLAPLPLMVVALGWGPLCATIGGIAAASGLGAIFGLPYCIAFVVMVALPAWWLGHLALLGRPVTTGVA